jgi:hypothetical protein
MTTVKFRIAQCELDEKGQNSGSVVTYRFPGQITPFGSNLGPFSECLGQEP